MCDGGRVERLYWIRRVEQLRQELEAGDRARQNAVRTPAKPDAPQADTADQEPVPA